MILCESDLNRVLTCPIQDMVARLSSFNMAYTLFSVPGSEAMRERVF